ncbi:preprotein translocase, SecE subunit [Catonella morbi ATCC 51271]|jgi:preprotein translocase, secE subunit|uniref:Protein translocase subunit SecE n=1 Tax=Catonella morbi ATCC 51271 TaxID=592026 RepID=V2Y1T3_9FIRM|nr:preprotein translocase subunit SecE [Catonella morbi]ESL01636.1 preprotein translocase, SecE subunit [Catonella morbi ATCC 51271]
MGDKANKTNENVAKTGFSQEVKSEFKKIIWPSKESLTKESVAVIATTIVLGAVVALIDLGIQYLINGVL